MPPSPTNFELPPAIRRILDAVRRRIRAYVWIEGVALLVALLGAAFWAGLLLDWLLEPTPVIRQVALALLAAASAWLVYRYILRRVFAPITDSTAALLLERKFPALSEHVLTAVTLSASPEKASHLHPSLVDQTNQAAAHAVAGIRPGELFNRGPLVRAVTLAVALLASIGLFAALANDAFGFWLQRLAMSNEPWPRRVQLEVVGFPPNAAGHRTEKLAQDDNYELTVHARIDEFEAPESVEIRYQLADGRRGRDTMIRVGDAQPGRDEFQLFRYEFKRVSADMTFDVVGGDDRVRDLELQVVDRPELHAIELECVYPSYLGRESRRLPVTRGMRIPEGTLLVLHAAATKPLVSAHIHRSQSQQDIHAKSDSHPAEELRWEYGPLTADDVLLVTVTDIDGVACREPYRVSLAVVPDEVPQIAVRLAGIGAAVTPEATIPVVGKVTDDYGLDCVWFQYQVEDGPEGTRQIAVRPAGIAQLQELGNFDLRASDTPGGQRALLLPPGSKLSFSLRANDRYDLNDDPRGGGSQPFVLDVVTVPQLLALIERRELELRQRFEAIFEKVTDTRNLLSRVEFAKPPSTDVDSGDEQPAQEQPANEQPAETTAADKPADSAGDNATNSTAAAAQRELARRRLRVAGSLQNIAQAAEEVIGVADGFDDLHDQLTNNRIDNPDLKSRLREQIAQPLHQIGEQRMPQLSALLKLVEKHVADDAAGPPALAQSVALADAILVEMQQVLDRMEELESYNEVVALLRDIISDQEEINRRTKERQKDRLQSLLED